MGKVLFMHPAKDAQVIPQPCASAFTAVAMHLPHAITIVIACPFTPPTAGPPVAHGRVLKLEFCLNFGVALPFVSIEHARPLMGRRFNYLQASYSVSRVPDEVAHQPARAPLDREDRRAVCRIGAVPAPFVGAPARRVSGVAMWSAFFPPRSGTTRRLPARRQVTVRSGARPASCAAPAAAVDARACARYSTPAPAAPSARLWQSRAAAGRVSRAIAVSSQRPSHSGACNSGRKLYSATMAIDHSVGRSGVRRSCNADSATHPGASIVLTSADKLPRPAVRLSGSQS